MKKIYISLLFFALIVCTKTKAQWSTNPLPYCVGTYVSGYTPCSDGAFIQSVTFGTINYNGLPCSSTYPWYRYWPMALGSQYTTQLVPGSTYTLTAVPGISVYASVPSAWGVWIDWNGDNDFTDADEFVHGTTGTVLPGQTIPGVAVTVPTTAVPGVHRMRVRNMWWFSGLPFFGLTSPLADACFAVNEDGETVDFDITIPGGPSTMIPPISNYAYNILIDTAWINSPYIFTNISNNANRSFWDITGYSTSINGPWSPVTATRVCATRWNTCYIDTVSLNFSWKFSQMGYYKVKLKTINNYGADSIEKIVVCAIPTKKPIASFFSLSKTAGFSDQLQYYDLSLNGPSAWEWTLNPPYRGQSTFAGSGLPNIFLDDAFQQHPKLNILDAGVFDVCLKVYNAIGSDTVCRKDYLTVSNGYMMCNGSDSLSTLSSGYVYDAGGPTGNYYTATTGTCPKGFRIAACADSIQLYIERFKLLGGDSVTIRRGGITGPIVKRLGGSSLHDTLRTWKIAGGEVFLQMTTTSTNINGDSGFAIRWSVTPATYSKPKAGFDVPATTIYSGYKMLYSNTSTGANMSYCWDTDGDGKFCYDPPLDSIAANPSRVFTTSVPITRNVCLRVSNCQGTDMFCRLITILPVVNKPIADFTVNRTSGFTTDTFRFTDKSVGATSWQWTFSPANVAYLAGTSATSQNPIVFLNSSSCYTVTLKATNNAGNDTRVIGSIACAVAYTSPGTQNAIPNGSDIGIRRVTLGSIDTTTALQSPIYTAMYNQKKTILYRGVDYTVTTYRVTNADPMSTKVWIDYSMNAIFTDAGETLIDETRQNKVSTSRTFRIPNNSPLGNTRMRVGISYDITTLTPDYAQIGCFEDYGIIIGTDYTLPVITLNGPAVFKMEVGKTFNDPWVTAMDNLEGDISSSVIRTGSVNVNQVGYYTVSYTVADLYGNVSVPVTRVVQVEVNQTGPTLTLNGADTIIVGVKGTYTEPGAVAKDNTGKDITNLIIVSGTLNTGELGTYSLTYSITDAFGFTTTKVRKVMVVDAVKPVITSVSGKDTIRHQIGTTYNDPVMVTDNYWNNLTAARTGSININVLGYYTLLYNVTDGSGNAAVPYRLVVKVDDLVAPAITLNGANDMTVDVNTLFVDPGVTVTDNYYTNVTVTKSPASGPNMTSLTTTDIVYTATDASGNTASVTRKVRVADRKAPVISINGANPYYQQRYQPYVDPGVSLSDNFYTETQLRTVLATDLSKVLHDRPGYYYVTYNLTDPSGNMATSKSRLVVVMESTTGVNAVDGSNTLNIYPNPSTGKFTIEQGDEKVHTIRIYNILGTLVKEIAVRGNNKVIDVDMTGMSEGMYIVKLESTGKSYTQKINIAR